MATLHNAMPARKKTVTYGKAVRRRIPEYTSIFTARKPVTPEADEITASLEFTDTAHEALPSNSGARRQRSISRALSSASPPPNIYDVSLSEDEAPLSTPKAGVTPAKKKTLPSRPTKRPSPFTSASDVFDVPASEDEGPKRKAPPKPKASVAKNTARRVTKQNTAPHKANLASQPAHDVFDVPPSDVEVEKKPKTPKIQRKVVARPDIQEKATPRADPGMVEVAGHKKRLKLSPANETSSPKLLPAQAIARRPKAALEKPPPKARNMSPRKVDDHTTRIVSRPKTQPLRSPPQAKRSKTPLQLSTPGGPSTPIEIIDVDMLDSEPYRPPISPKGLKMWETLLDPVDDDEMSIDVALPSNDRKYDRSSPKKLSSPLSRPAGITKAAQKKPKVMPRRRLIDSLVEQAAADSSGESSAEEDSDLSADSNPSSQVIMQDMSRSQSVAPEASGRPPIPSDSQGSQGVGPKFTYSKQRSMLAEADLMAELALEMPLPPPQSSNGRRGRMASVAPMKPMTSFHEDDGDEGLAAAVKSVHELRKSGANNRFMDEVQDYLDRIGSPGKTSISMRRSGLFDLASKMKDKAFVEKFRANSIEQRLFLHLGQETDIVAGFMMVSILTSVLIDGNMPHVVTQLRRQGITRLLIRLLECQASLAVLAKDRKSNMSKIAQSMLIEQGEYVIQLPTWEEQEVKPQALSPRTMALKCLEVMVRQTREAGNPGDIFSKELTTNLFAIMKSASDESAWNLPQDKYAIDFFLALSALESHSIKARTVDNELIWINDYLPIVADTLEIALARPAESHGILQLLLLRLTLNVTNNNRKASDVFARPKLLSIIGQLIVAKFKQILRFLTEDELNVALDLLILALGVMINFAEWSSNARESMQSLEGGSDDPLDAMAQIFADNQEKAAQADSMEDSSKNVAFGYLSVLLGYFSLLPAISQRIAAKQPRKTLRPIVASIEEFIGHHKTVDMIAADEDGYNPQSGLTERLENLVSKLAALKSGGK